MVVLLVVALLAGQAAATRWVSVEKEKVEVGLPFDCGEQAGQALGVGQGQTAPTHVGINLSRNGTHAEPEPAGLHMPDGQEEHAGGGRPRRAARAGRVRLRLRAHGATSAPSDQGWPWLGHVPFVVEIVLWPALAGTQGFARQWPLVSGRRG